MRIAGLVLLVALVTGCETEGEKKDEATPEAADTTISEIDTAIPPDTTLYIR